MYAEDEGSDWDEIDSEEERREAEEALYHQIYHTYQGIENLKDGLVMRENASFQNGLDISKSGGILSKEIKVPSTSLEYIELWMNVKRCRKDEDLTSQLSKGENKVKGAHNSDSEIINSDSKGSLNSENTLSVKQAVRTYGKVTVTKPTKKPSPLKVRNRDTFRELSRGCLLGKSNQGPSFADEELEGFQKSEDDDLEDWIELVDSRKGGSVIKYESSSRILGSDCQNITEKKETKPKPSKILENGKNEWSPFISKRYFTQHQLGDDQLKCYNCFMPGHTAKECPEPQADPTCPLCGVKGHTSYVCPHQLCFNCDRPGHQSKLCPFPYQSPYYQCSRCTMYGHMEQMCPDNWRQYHLTTVDGELITAEKPRLKADKMCCYNCGLKGHLGHMCKKPRMTVRKGEMIKLPSMPVVCLYKKQTTRKPGRKLEQHVTFTDMEDDFEKKLYHYMKQKRMRLNQKLKKYIKLPEDDVDTERKECHNKKQKKKKKPNGKMGKHIIFNDVNTKRKGKRRAHPQSSSLEAESEETKWRKFKKKQRKKWRQSEFDINVAEIDLFNMKLRPRKNQNKRYNTDPAAEKGLGV